MTFGIFNYSNPNSTLSFKNFNWTGTAYTLKPNMSMMFNILANMTYINITNFSTIVTPIIAKANSSIFANLAVNAAINMTNVNVSFGNTTNQAQIQATVAN